MSISEERSFASRFTASPPFSSLSIELHLSIIERGLLSSSWEINSLPLIVNPCEYASLPCWDDIKEVLPYLSESKLANLLALSSYIIDIPTQSSPICLPWSVATSTAVFNTFCRISIPPSLISYPKISCTDSLAPVRLITILLVPSCMNCVLLASVGNIPFRMRSISAFFRIDIADNAGFIISASLARKYVSSLLDWYASLGRLIDNDCKVAIVPDETLLPINL